MKPKTWFLSLFPFFSSLVSAEPLLVGSPLPVLKGKNQEGEVVTLTAAKGDEWLLIFTYPKALTGG